MNQLGPDAKDKKTTLFFRNDQQKEWYEESEK